MSAVVRMEDAALLESARSGEQDAFARLLAPYRSELTAHCYRMLGSVDDAEDALQETLLRAWRGLQRFEGRSSLRSWLYSIATNVCLRAVERRPRRLLPIEHGPPADPHDELAPPLLDSVWIEPFADEEQDDEAPAARYERRESIELAFVAALQHLPARQRAVLILRDVLGFSAREVAATLEASPPSVDSALQRARRSVERRLPAQSQQATLRALGDARLSELVGAYVSAWESGDVEAVVAMLAHDARIAMPPIPTWYRGREAVGRFLSGRALSGERPRRLLPICANGVPAFGQYTWSEEQQRLRAHGVMVLAFEGERIAEIAAFLTPRALARFGLPQELAA